MRMLVLKQDTPGPGQYFRPISAAMTASPHNTRSSVYYELSSAFVTKYCQAYSPGQSFYKNEFRQIKLYDLSPRTSYGS